VTIFGSVCFLATNFVLKDYMTCTFNIGKMVPKVVW